VIEAGRHTNVPDDIDTHVPLKFGAFCSLASGLTIVSGQHPPVDSPAAVANFPFAEWGWGDYPPCTEDGGVEVGSDVWIGKNVTILDGVKVGHGAIIGAGSVVTGWVLPYVVVAGNPATTKRTRFTDAQIKKLLDMAWWDWTDEEIKKALPAMSDIERFT